MKIEQILTEFKNKAAKLYGKRLKDIILYGSYATGRANQNSDIDLAIVLDGNVKAGKEIDRLIDIITDINLNYSVLLSVYPVSEKDYYLLKSPLMLNMRREGIPA
jgi:predicted nucleotidyltransferase